VVTVGKNVISVNFPTQYSKILSYTRKLWFSANLALHIWSCSCLKFFILDTFAQQIAKLRVFNCVLLQLHTILRWNITTTTIRYITNIRQAFSVTACHVNLCFKHQPPSKFGKCRHLQWNLHGFLLKSKCSNVAVSQQISLTILQVQSFSQKQLLV